MKKLIKKWLGIDKLEQLKVPSDQELRMLVGKAYVDALMNRSDEERHIFRSFWGWNTDMDNLLNSIIKSESSKRAYDTAIETTKKYISQEEFIDQIIERIKRKQLN